MIFTRKSSDRAYVSDNLWLPKALINQEAVKRALEVYPTNDPANVKLPVRLWKESKHHLIVPRLFILPEQYSEYKFKFINLQPEEFPKIQIEHTVIPRDDSQKKSIQALISANHGILNLACGKGKTTVALAAIAEIGTPAIIVVNNQHIMKQWEEMIRKHWNYDGPVGIVQQKQFDWEHPITLAMIQTLSGHAGEWSAEFRRHFGVVIFDEVHHLSAPTFVRTADLFFGRRWGLTATPSRADGLEIVYYYHIGKPIYIDLEQELIPQTFFIQTNVRPASEQEAKRLFLDKARQENISKIRSWLGQHEERNKMILREVARARGEGRKILALTHSRDHAISLYEQCEGSGLCIGPMDPEERLEMLRERDITFATAKIASEALDEPSLDTLFILTPFGDANALQQSLGRIQRIRVEKKPPLVVVFEDDIGYCKGLCGKMKQYLREQKYPFKTVRSQA